MCHQRDLGFYYRNYKSILSFYNSGSFKNNEYNIQSILADSILVASVQTGGCNKYKYLLIGMTKKEKIFIATREKEKGNEAFASGDYVEAVTYYTR